LINNLGTLNPTTTDISSVSGASKSIRQDQALKYTSGLRALLGAQMPRGVLALLR
jgi:hypothetical protein